MVRFVHTADWQLGMTRHFLSPEAQARFTAARIDAIRTIGQLAVTEGCGFVVVCGDVFETNHVQRQVVVRALDAMAATPQVTFYLLAGNHDPLDASSVLRSPTFRQHQPENVVVLDRSPHPVTDGVELVPAPWRSKRPLGDLVTEAARHLRPDDTIRIAIGHGAVDALAPESTDPALISLRDLEEALADGRLHYVALGDRHSTTSLGSTGRVRYSGAPEPTDFVEVDAGNALVVEVDADRVDVVPHRVASWRFVPLQFDVTGDADIDRLDAQLGSFDDKARTVVRLALVGQVSLVQKARLDAVVAHHSDLLAALEGWHSRTDLAVVPDDADLGALPLAGFAGDALADLRDLAAHPGPDAETARDALALLHRLGSPAA